MDKNQIKRSAITLGLICGLAGAPGALADINIEDRTKEGRAERFSLDVRDEPIDKVMDELAEHFNFDVDGYPDHWSKDPMSFSATGDLERVLRSLLKDTSHVFEYRTDLKTNKTRITSLKLLNEGIEGIITNPPTSKTQAASLNAKRQADGSGLKGGNQRERLSAEGNSLELRDADIASSSSTNNDSANSNGRNLSGAGTPRVSGLSKSLEARARQSSALANTPSSASTTQATTGSPATSVSDADMQALTQKALQDVQGLAEALRKAEGK